MSQYEVAEAIRKLSQQVHQFAHEYDRAKKGMDSNFNSKAIELREAANSLISSATTSIARAREVRYQGDFKTASPTRGSFSPTRIERPPSPMRQSFVVSPPLGGMTSASNYRSAQSSRDTNTRLSTSPVLVRRG